MTRAPASDPWREIRRAFEAQLPEPEERSAPRGVSAVLLLLAPSVEGPALVYTRRTQSLRSHPGQVSFPGGRVDPTDVTPLDAALREAEEEVGLSPRDVDVLGHLTDFMTYREQLVCAYAGVLRAGAPAPTLPRSVEEVDEVFHVPVSHLLDASRYEGRTMDGLPGPARRVHYWRVANHVVWGITGELTARYLARAHAWSPPAPARRVASPDELLPEPSSSSAGRARSA